MSSLYIVRRAAKKAPRIAKARLQEATSGARVQRPSLVDFFTSGAFNRLPVVSVSTIDSDQKRQEAAKASGWQIPADSLGRKGEATPSQGESVRLWVKQHLAPLGIDPESVSIVLVKD